MQDRLPPPKTPSDEDTGADASAAPVLSAALHGRAGAFEIDASFTMPGAGVTALFGPSGSGKTTTLRAIAGLHRLSGNLTVGGEVWQADEPRGAQMGATQFLPPHQRSVGYVFQEASLFPHLTVAENIRFATRRPLWRQPFGPARARATEQRFDELVAVLGIDDLVERYPARLSGGERQRVAIARALLPAPKLLLMDEPLSAVDRGTKDEILRYLDVIAGAFETPMLYVSHDLSEITRIADYLVLLGRGRVTAEGPIDDLLTRLDLNPDLGRFEAGVLLTAEVSGFDETTHLTRLVLIGAAEQLLAVNHRADAAPQAPLAITVPGRIGAVGDSVRLRVRARDVSLAITRPEGISIRNVLPGTLSQIAEEPETGYAETLVQVGPAQVRARITRDAVAALGLEAGRDVFVMIKAISFDGRARRSGRQNPMSSSTKRSD